MPVAVVPAQAGPHTPQHGDVAQPSMQWSIGGYGSPPARGRQQVTLYTTSKIRRARDCGPVPMLLRNQLGKILRRAESRLHSEPSDVRLSLTRAQAVVDHRVEAIDDRLRRTGGRQHAIPVEADDAR